MPLIALDILESKIKELLVVIKHLKEENTRVKNALASAAASGGAPALSPELLSELDSLKKQVEKYKSDRVKLYAKISSAVKQVEEITEKGHNG
jgi:hypothetical protein